MSREVKRSARVAERMREELSMMVRGLRDPRVVGTLVTRIELTDDLSFARIYVRKDVGADDEQSRRSLVKGLESAAGKLRGDLTRALGLRVAPGLRFFYDEGIDHQTRVEELLREIADEQK
jgi:ribosome-binding factor A